MKSTFNTRVRSIGDTAAASAPILRREYTVVRSNGPTRARHRRDGSTRRRRAVGAKCQATNEASCWLAVCLILVCDVQCLHWWRGAMHGADQDQVVPGSRRETRSWATTHGIDSL